MLPPSGQPSDTLIRKRAADDEPEGGPLPAPGRPGEVFLSIVMPAYNEAATIRRAVEHVLDAPYPCPIELIVVDDGSSDGTYEQLSGFEDPRLQIHRHVRNLGKGAALLTGMAVARGTHLLPFDADLEYSAEDIPRLLAPVMAGRAQVVYGTRLFGANTVYSSFRYGAGNKAMTMLANVLFDSYISDLHTCLKLVPLDLLRGMRLTETRFGLDTEITASVLRHGYRPFEVPVSYYSRTRAAGKKIGWRDAVSCVRVLGRVRLSQPAAALLADTSQRHLHVVPARPATTAERVVLSLPDAPSNVALRVPAAAEAGE
ncbi:glycosyltransferase family 2 protein [Motilibacter sp. K478]|nr:glycosyltransferase family 2 protein [Motilibacter aurantiacus]